MSKYKIFLLIFIVLVCSILSGFYFYNKHQETEKQKLFDAKKRLIELTISREKFFWNCFSNKSNELENEWKNTESYKSNFENCKSKTTTAYADITCKFTANERPWRRWNEEVSKFCSESADNTQDGVLIKKYRAIVPIEMLTDNELKKYANKYREF